MTAPRRVSDEQLSAVSDPGVLLEHAWALEPWGRYDERTEVLDALETLLTTPEVASSPPGRDWELELMAERAIDAGRSWELEEARTLVAEVISRADTGHEIAVARAMLAAGQALAWVGTDEATRESNRAFADAAERFAVLGRRDWQGSALLRRGYSACYQHGDLVQAEALIRTAVETYPPDSMRLAGACCSHADVLIDLGEFDRAAGALDRAAAYAERDGFAHGRADQIWAGARLAAGRRDARATERLLREAEREAADTDWFETHIGLSFLVGSAELLDGVGLTEEAHGYLQRGRERAGEDNEEVMQATASLRARSGDPGLALAELQRLARGGWLEKRLTWRHTLLTAWATFRAGREGAGEIAARGLREAIACGGPRVAMAAEPEVVSALAPLAEAAGSSDARELLLSGRELLIRLFGNPSIVRRDGSAVALPPGMPGELVRRLALHEHGLPVDVVLETFFPDAPPPAARQRLRQVLTRVRAGAGTIVVRDGETLRLVPAWVDAREFAVARNRVRAATGARAVQLAYAALALCTGPLLPSDPYAEWAEQARQEFRLRHLELLDLVADDAAGRGSHQEALTALEAALEEDAETERRRTSMAAQLRALGRDRAADYLERD